VADFRVGLLLGEKAGIPAGIWAFKLALNEFRRGRSQEQIEFRRGRSQEQRGFHPWEEKKGA